MIKQRALCVFLFVLSLTAFTFAQTATTSLRGTVKDPSGAVVPGAAISLTDNATGKVLQTTSGSGGEYQFNQIPPAKYTIKVTAGGFANQSKVAELLVNQPATIDFSLSVQASEEVVNVSAEAETLNTSDATLGNSFNNATIQSLPSEGRNVPQLLALQPGVLYLGQDNDQKNDSRSGAVNGGRSDQGNVTIDGLDDNDQITGDAFTGILRQTLDSVEEFRVTTSNSNSDSGRSSGAQISMVTKSGTNQFHGSVYEYHRPTFTVANDWFNKQAQLANGEPNIPGKLIRNTFGAAVGGPIKKDKLFFFANYEGQRTAENTQVNQTAPTATFQQGLVIYQYTTDGQTVAGNQTLTAADIAKMDPNCSGNGTCPWGPGINPNALAVFAKQYPAANGSNAGDGGFNSGSYTFSSPSPGSLNTSIAKLDYRPSDRQAFFVRGNLQKDTSAGPEQFPGQPPSFNLVDNSKGIAGGYTLTLTPNLVNDLRYGYTRQGFSNRGQVDDDYVSFRFLNQPLARTFSTLQNVPVHNIVDNVSWTKGRHTISGGANWRLISNNNTTNTNSFTIASTNEYWLVNGGTIANTGTSLDPAAFGYPAVCCGTSNGFTNSYNIAIGLITGLVPETEAQYNYNVSADGTTGNQYADGAFIKRQFKANEFEYYLQDAWRVSPKLTLTFGIRHSLLQTPYETSGQQLAPTTSTHDWFMQRAANAALGNPYEPILTFAPNGQARGKSAYWPMQKNNIAPRFSFAYAADSKTSIRGGFGMFYDHFGQGIVSSFDQLGSFGLTTTVTTPASTYSADTSPRFTGINSIPALPPGLGQPSTISYPYTPPVTGFAIAFGLDDHLKTPYSYAADFSIQKELGQGFVFETAYVGRFGRHLMQQLDLAEPVNFVDTKSATNYFTAATELSKDVDESLTTVPTIPYWEDLFPNLATGGTSATQYIYDNFWVFNRGNETGALQALDTPQSVGGAGACDPSNGGLGCYRFWQPQFSSLFSFSSIGNSSYNALQFILRHAMSHGLEVDLSYVFSKSLDMGSDTERMVYNTGFSTILNSFNPKLNKGVSDFDTANNVTANWVYQLPVGRGQHFGGGMNGWADAFLGGWQWSGLYRWTTGLPFGIIAPAWGTNYEVQSYMVKTGPVMTHKHIQSNGSPQAFADPNNLALRLPYPGEAGERNNFRGDGIFDIDSGLTKSWKITEGQNVKFSWEVFNVTNSVRYDLNATTTTSFTNTYGSGALGVYAATMSLPRKMQFSLRYSF
ncbi:TonB-dependent receptor [Alloacidobacterium sp.]|uniref:TonB-dependent receptor n=1 Tax=Alloacidobacterium sp. TaxID=2951999 RepID=UPI002D43BB79|nr:TonB-dependent receptor [Alloacidobacterium sp.]HYK35553.1 TonB-dependent receptor [Alloacidobacterium sp.]